jgi:hypothetical protein
MASNKKNPTTTPTNTPGNPFDPESIAGIMPEGFECKTNSQGNVQCLISNLRSLNDYQKCKLLVAGADALHKAGIISDPAKLIGQECPVTLSWNTKKLDEDGNPIYRPYPKLWANQPNAETTQRVATNSAASKAVEIGEQNSRDIADLVGAVKHLASSMVASAAPATPSATPDNPNTEAQADIPFA